MTKRRVTQRRRVATVPEAPCTGYEGVKPHLTPFGEWWDGAAAEIAAILDRCPEPLADDAARSVLFDALRKTRRSALPEPSEDTRTETGNASAPQESTSPPTPHAPDVKEWSTVAAGTTRIGACATCGRDAHDHQDGEWNHGDPEAPHFHPAEVRRAGQVRAAAARIDESISERTLPGDPGFIAEAVAMFLRSLEGDGYNPRWILCEVHDVLERTER